MHHYRHLGKPNAGDHRNDRDEFEGKRRDLADCEANGSFFIQPASEDREPVMNFRRSRFHSPIHACLRRRKSNPAISRTTPMMIANRPVRGKLEAGVVAGSVGDGCAVSAGGGKVGEGCSMGCSVGVAVGAGGGSWVGTGEGGAVGEFSGAAVAVGPMLLHSSRIHRGGFSLSYWIVLFNIPIRAADGRGALGRSL